MSPRPYPYSGLEVLSGRGVALASVPGLPERLASARTHGLYWEFSGGLGDIIHGTSRCNMYPRLELLEPDDEAVVVFFCHNPHVTELLAWHPAARQILVLSLGFADWQDPAVRARHGLPSPALASGGTPNADFLPYPSPRDLVELATLPNRYAVFAVTASSGPGEGRSLPEPIVADAVRICAARDLPAVFTGRRYLRTVGLDGETGYHAEWEPAPGSISMIDRLTVPGTLECLRRSSVAVLCHSALLLPSWRMRRPTFVSCPAEMWRPDPGGGWRHNGYMFGLDFPENDGCVHGDWTPERFEHFLRRVT